MEQMGINPCTQGPACCPVSTATITSEGTLPPVVVLAAGYVPTQKPGCIQFESKDALQHGTLYPALFLPFRNMYKTEDLPDTPLVQLMALNFAMIELNLYLDTHPSDHDALEMHRDYRELFRKMKKQYEKQYGPVMARDSDDPNFFTWVSDPWPWDKQKGE